MPLTVSAARVCFGTHPIPDEESVFEYLLGILNDEDTASTLSAEDLAGMVEALVADVPEPANVAAALLKATQAPPEAASSPAPAGSLPPAPAPGSRSAKRRQRKASHVSDAPTLLPTPTPAVGSAPTAPPAPLAAAPPPPVPSKPSTPPKSAPTSHKLVEKSLKDLEDLEDWGTAWEDVKRSGVTWGGPGFGGRALKRRTQFAAGKDIVVDGVTMAFSGNELLLDSELRFHHGHRYGLIGDNGTGKSTLLRRMVRASIPGFPLHLRLAYVSQEITATPDFNAVTFLLECMKDDSEDGATGSFTVSGTVAAGAGAGDGDSEDPEVLALRAEQAELEAALEAGADDAEAISTRLCALYDRLDELTGESEGSSSDGGTDVVDSVEGRRRYRIEKLLRRMGFTKDLREKPTSALSGGWRARLALAAALLGRPDVLVLDEPTNHLDLHGVLWLQRFLTGKGLKDNGCHTLILVSHDRVFLDAVATDIVHLSEKRLHYFPGTLQQWLTRNEERAQSHSRMLDARMRQEKKALAFVASARTAGKTSTGKSKKFVDEKRQKQAKQKKDKVERIGMYRDDGKRFKTKSMPKFDVKALRMPQRVEYLKAARGIKFHFPSPRDVASTLRSVTDRTAPIIRLSNAAVGYGDDKPPVLSGVTLQISLSTRVAVVGANGSGKSTLLKLLTGDLPPRESTEATWTHHNLRIAHIAQHHLDAFDSAAELTSSQYVARKFGVSEEEARGPLGRCGLAGELALRAIGTLSGGQKARLAMTVAVWDNPHVLVLDEPSNHLSWDALDALALALDDYGGAVVLVSHDTFMMKAVCNELWVVEDGTVRSSGRLVSAAEDDEGETFSAAFDKYASKVVKAMKKERL